jgi:hypothetical protein
MASRLSSESQFHQRNHLLSTRYSQTETLGCDCGEIMIFTGALTAQQVKDNYNYFSGRFGWAPV